MSVEQDDSPVEEMRVPVYAALIIDGEEVTERRACTLTIGGTWFALAMRVEGRDMAFSAPKQGKGSVRYFLAPSGEAWAVEVGCDAYLSPGLSVRIGDERTNSRE